MAHYNCIEPCNRVEEDHSTLNNAETIPASILTSRTPTALRVTDSYSAPVRILMFDTRRNLFAHSLIVLAVFFDTGKSAGQATPLRIGLITPAYSAAASSIDRGVRLGAFEAKQTATLFGGDVLLIEEKSVGNPDQAAERLLSRGKVQILIGSSAKDADALSRFAESHQVIFFNVASRAPALRAACRRYTFHVEAGDSMYAIASGGGASAANTLLWAGTLERYGASQINNRFRARYQTPMDGGAWAGWVAVKIAAEAALRAHSVKAGAILSYLETPSTTFDGHKGWPLSFRSWDHQLRQPLYVASRASSAGGPAFRDVPQLNTMAGGNGGDTNAGQALDVLMPKSAPRCRWAR